MGVGVGKIALPPCVLYNNVIDVFSFELTFHASYARSDDSIWVRDMPSQLTPFGPERIATTATDFVVEVLY